MLRWNLANADMESIMRPLNFIKKGYAALLLIFGILHHPHTLNGAELEDQLTYYLNIDDFAASFIEIPTSNVSVGSPTISSKYLAGRAAVYNADDLKVGTCSASFLCMQNADGIYTDISNFLSVANGLVVSWLTPTTLINLELDSIVNSMVTQCIVVASTAIGFNIAYGQTYSLIVSSLGGRIYFQFSRMGTVF